MQDSIGRFMLRLAPMIYGPTLLFAIGEGVVIPLFPTMAARLGADLATSALVASCLLIGQLCGNLPSSWVVARLGERAAMVIAGSLSLLGAFGMLYAPNVLVLALSIFILGMCAAAFGLARHSFMTSRVPFAFRARALSLLGGTFRLGMFIGPFLGALLLGLTGNEASALWCLVICLVLCVVLVWFGPDPEREYARRIDGMPASSGEPQERDGILRTMVKYRAVLSRLGLAAASLAAIRSARNVVLPLWGVSLALDAQTISLIVGIAGALDFALFYASGQIMDRFGRLAAVTPAMILMGLGFGTLAFTHDFPGAEIWFVVLAAVIGVGNGLSSGILLTLGADVAPRDNPAPFLGSWRTLTDGGGATGTLGFSAVAAIAPLGVATGFMGIIGLLGAVGFLYWVPKYAGKRETTVEPSPAE